MNNFDPKIELIFTLEKLGELAARFSSESGLTFGTKMVCVTLHAYCKARVKELRKDYK